MTAQMHNSFLLQDQKFSLVGYASEGLFQPSEYGMQPLPSVTSCWRGYVCTYKALHNRLLLDTLQVNLSQEGPAIQNIGPEFPAGGMFNHVYHDLDLPMDYSGGMLVADGFIRELYVHMGFHPAWKYETVFELVFSRGTLLKTKDVSQRMAELRREMTKKPLQPGPDTPRQKLEEWIASTFKRSNRSLRCTAFENYSSWGSCSRFFSQPVGPLLHPADNHTDWPASHLDSPCHGDSPCRPPLSFPPLLPSLPLPPCPRRPRTRSACCASASRIRCFPRTGAGPPIATRKNCAWSTARIRCVTGHCPARCSTTAARSIR